jgi:vanillate O-demethylase ferredoxin subunit
MNQPGSQTAPAVGVKDLNALKEFAADKRVRTALFKDGQLISEMVCYEPGQSSIAHQHPRQDELFFVIDGCVNMNVGGTEYALPAGSVMSLKSGIMHDVRNLGTERSVIVFVKMAADLAPSGKPPLHEPRPRADTQVTALPGTGGRSAENTIEVQVQAITKEAETIHSFELRAAGPMPLPPFTAGAHVEVHMKEHLARSYSIANDPGETDRYVIAANREEAGRGGSSFMHSQVRVGQILRITAPRNNFELFENAGHTVFVAGGIGITPVLSMIARLDRIGKPWTLHYCGRDRKSMAYLDLLEAKKRLGADVRLHVDSETGGKFLDIARVVAEAPADSHFYCCGPKPMLQAFEAATSGLPEERVHLEYFTAKGEAALQGGFVIELARSRKTLDVPAGKSILDTLLDADVFVDYSCKEGICGSCRVTVLDGVPDHRDSVLSDKEHQANDLMLVCCSGARSPRLVLNL